MAPLVTVVVPCYNYGRYLAECVNSIRAQGVDNLEIIIVDDGSADETPRVASGFDDARIRVIRHAANQGLVASLTDGLLAARGQYIARIDADDRYRPYFLDEALALFAAYPDVGMVYGDVAAIDGDGRITEDPWHGIASREAHGGRDFRGDELLATVENNVVPTAAMIATRDAYLRALPFPDWFTSWGLSDWYINLRIAEAYPICYRARTLGDYRLHPDNMHRQALAVRRYEQTVLGTLDAVFGGGDRVEAKRAIRRRVYGRAYLSFANQYFAQGATREARRCYIRAMTYSPSHGLRVTPVRRLAATFVPPAVYGRLKCVGR
jgi:glycosyltransferase involved in cell wall biosynthesis